MGIGGTDLDVSSETIDKLHAYEGLVRKWNPKINLVSKSTLEHLWDRHILDSLQIKGLSGTPANWTDIGSGGGFPGLVLAIAFAECNPDLCLTLVESDQRKAAFLRVVSGQLGLNTRIIAKRVEQIPSLQSAVISARALAPLGTLLSYAERHLASDGTCLFFKGESYRKELTESLESWRFQSEIIPSQTNPSAVILMIKDIARV